MGAAKKADDYPVPPQILQQIKRFRRKKWPVTDAIERSPVWGMSYRAGERPNIGWNRSTGWARPLVVGRPGPVYYLNAEALDRIAQHSLVSWDRDRPNGVRPMPTYDQEVRQVEESREGKTQIHDPLLIVFQSPKLAGRKNWKDVAEMYHTVATRYARENNRHVDELSEVQRQQQAWKIDQLERSTKEYERLQEQIKRRDEAIQQMKDMIHLLTRRGI